MTEKIQAGSRPVSNDELDLRQAAGEGAETDARLNQALADFRSSVNAWSEAAYSRARMAEIRVRRRSWRLAAGWALGCALVAGGITGGIVEHQRQQEAARIAAADGQQAQRQQMAMALKHAQSQDHVQDAGLMAKVDSDTAQEVPDAMQPLAQLMEDVGNQ
jgi:uncharacterized protein YpuA (DUF1002 family)